MPRLFIDIDDTLVIFPDHLPGPNPFGVTNGLPHRTNEPLVDAVREWLALNSAGQVVFWLGGGEEYARNVASRLIPDIAAWYFTKSGQNLGLPGTGDTVVDDDRVSLGTEMVLPEILLPGQFIELMAD